MKSFLDWLFRLFRAAPPSTPTSVPQAPEPTVVPTVGDMIAPELRAGLRDRDENPDKPKAFFRHAQKRMTERYPHLVLDEVIWEGWNRQIREKESMVLFVEDTEQGGQVWRVWFGTSVVFVVFRDGMVVTVLPNRGQFDAAIRREMRKRAAEHSEPPKTTWKPSPRNSNAPPLPPRVLPPRHKRPGRDENALARLRAQSLGLDRDDD